jgi:hypothetical protein
MKCTRKGDVFELEIDGKVVNYPVIELPKEFVEWNLGHRVGLLRGMLKGQRPSTSGGFGVHLPVMCTVNAKGSLFPSNLANKGHGFVAKEKYLEYYIEKWRKIIKETELTGKIPPEEMMKRMLPRMEAILEFYETPDRLDLRCLAGLEIWPGTSTRNFRADPRVSLHFLGMPDPKRPTKYLQWQVNCIWEEIKPGDPRYEFGDVLRFLTLGRVGRGIVPGHVPIMGTPVRGKHPFGWLLWVVEVLDKGIDTIPK